MTNETTINQIVTNNKLFSTERMIESINKQLKLLHRKKHVNHSAFTLIQVKAGEMMNGISVALISRNLLLINLYQRKLLK